ncbi:MAG: citramalate synthase [Bosea sp.]|uniref:citramalate synthase n=1 Tax=Bosea sp. (in: a-proteobacteria) TaxID=1871050 RepID=UPI002395D424|nr:citramalate synthase [Bosea sp. (in: a-proteobacteria)]MCP4737110.1 citramalate synthase [Bosea sp. (in: a-proteobacteria)]
MSASASATLAEATPRKGGEATLARIHLFDTTLRDGAQTTGVDFSLDDKRAVAGLLDKLGIDYVEGGYPGANPLDTAFFAQKPTQRAKFAAFGMTKRAGRSASNDPGIAALLDAKADAIVFVAKSWDYHVHVALEISLEDNLDGIRDSVATARAAGREVMLDCEHFFDGYNANPDYALACARAAYEAGARWVVLCDTNGGTLPDEISRIVAEVAKVVPGDNLGIHAHDDCGCAVANSLAAVEAGVRQIQGTLNGLGERCGNANLVTLIGALKLKDRYNRRFSLGVGEAELGELTHVSRALDEMLNRAPNRHAPFVGSSAFATKAGIHASAVLKDPRTYEHVAPDLVGNVRKVLVSDQGGKSNLVAELERIGVTIGRDDPRLSRVLEELKEKEAQGYAFEGADASFYLLAKRILGELPDYFEIERFTANVERRYNALGELVTFSEAIVKVKVGEEPLISVAESALGPVNALDLALRKDLGRYQSLIGGLRLVDYKVRVFQGGTDAVTRVLIESADETGERWTTVGVSANIIDASFQALVDSITYKLMREGATA